MPCFFNTGVHYLEECGEYWCSLIGVDRHYIVALTLVGMH